MSETRTAHTARDRISWWVYAGAERVRHTAQMRGTHNYDATCSCGWDSKTGGGLKRYVSELVQAHKNEAPTAAAPTYEPGDRVYRYWDSVALGMEVQPLTVVRVNRLSVTVRTDQGSTFRLAPEAIEGPYVDDPTPAAPSVPPVSQLAVGASRTAAANVIPLAGGTARRPIVRAKSSAAPRSLAPANVRVTEWFGAHLDLPVGILRVARALGCSQREVTHMCTRLIAAGLMVRRGSRYTMVVPAGTSVTVVK